MFISRYLAESKNELILGFDLEWPFNYKFGAGKTSLMQICPDEELCYIFHVSIRRTLILI